MPKAACCSMFKGFVNEVNNDDYASKITKGKKREKKGKNVKSIDK